MFGVFRALKAEGEEAVRKTIWLVAGAILFLFAAGFAATALAFALAPSMTLPMALLVSAGAVMLAGVICIAAAEREARLATPVQPAASAAHLHAAANPAAGLFGAAGLDRNTQAMLLAKAQTRPLSMLAIAAAAGLAVAALDASDDD